VLLLTIIYTINLPVVRPRSCRVIYYFDTLALGRRHQSFGRVKKHKDQIDANNTALNRTNMLLIEKMTETDEHMDETATHARIIRINARKVGRDIIRYRRSLAETDAFLGKIENRSFAFLPLAREFVEERD